MNEVLNNEVKKIYYIRMAFSQPWEYLTKKPYQIYQTFNIEKETEKCYKTTRGKLIRKSTLNIPTVEYGGDIQVISTTPNLTEEALVETIKLLEEQNRKQKMDYDVSSNTLHYLYKLRGDKENA